MTPKDLKITNLSNKSYPEMLIAIAKERQGYLNVVDAVNVLFKAQVGKDRLSIQNNIYSALNRMGKTFVKRSPGQYWYIGNGQDKDISKPSGLRNAVKAIKELKPQMTKQEVLNTLIQSGFDFKGKRPIQAVNITWAYLGYSKEGKTQSLF